jgi:hypothetical protein
VTRAARLAAAIAGAAGLAGCGNDRAAPGDVGDGAPPAACAGDPAAFVRQAQLALDGRRPLGQDEVDVYVDLYRAAAAGGDAPRPLVARAIMARPEFRERWVDFAIDALHVQRTDVQSEATCWGQALRGSTPGVALAAAVRDQPATAAGDGDPFTLLDLARSAIELDDLTPLWRAQLFSLVAHPIPAANLDPVAAELARRDDAGATFDAAYLHRDPVCLGCHTSDASVTDSDDPALDRFWPVAGAPEDAVFARPLAADTATRAHAVFRTDGFLDGGRLHPWGWAAACGQFAAAVADDPAGVDADLGALTGRRVTALDLAAALGRGFTALRARAPTGPIADPDTALAWLVTLTLTEDVWRQVTGTPLTIANYFPRNRAARDLLGGLAATLASSGYSLRAVLAAIVSSPYFAVQPPDAACGASPYSDPAIFDPWTSGELDTALRGNGPGDAVTALDATTLISALGGALEWPAPFGAARFPGPAEAAFEHGIGAFLRTGERAFRGLDFQARLVWEAQVGTCAPPGGAPDFVDRLVAAGATTPGATAADLVRALKDRLIGEPTIADGAERAALSALIGPLDAPAGSVPADRLRAVCGALVEAPQFLLQGIAGAGGARPVLTPASASYAAICSALEAGGIGVPDRAVRCGDRSLVLERR